jgi:hypothetical protein
MCHAELDLGVTAETVRNWCERFRWASEPKARAKGAKSTNPNGRPKNHSHPTVLGRGSDYLTARIARDHPDILKRMKAGEFPSTRAAAIAAGIVKVPTPLDLGRRGRPKKGEEKGVINTLSDSQRGEHKVA